MPKRFTIAVLAFGEYPQLLRRVLDSILDRPDLGDVVELRLGLNGLGPMARRLLEERLNRPSPIPIHVTSVVSPTGEHPKYPMMRRLFYDRPIASEYLVWFDDDSFLRPVPDFFAWLAGKMADRDLLGSRYHIGLSPEQKCWIACQKWYRGRPYLFRDPKGQERCAFFNGAFWCARTQLLQAVNYPWPELYHNGGDVMLGVCALQQDWRANLDHRDPELARRVAINADEHGRESEAPRRGLNLAPIGTGFQGLSCAV